MARTSSCTISPTCCDTRSNASPAKCARRRRTCESLVTFQWGPRSRGTGRAPMPVNDEPDYPVEPWRVREVGLSWETIAQSESLFALSNGHIGLRGNLDEGDPNGLPGTYLNSFFETRPLPYAESGFGYPESGQTILNVTNGKLIRLLVDDEPFDLRYGHLTKHERILDLRRGILLRSVDWISPAGRRVRV